MTNAISIISHLFINTAMIILNLEHKATLIQFKRFTTHQNSPLKQSRGLSLLATAQAFIFSQRICATFSRSVSIAKPEQRTYRSFSNKDKKKKKKIRNKNNYSKTVFRSTHHSNNAAEITYQLAHAIFYPPNFHLQPHHLQVPQSCLMHCHWIH